MAKKISGIITQVKEDGEKWKLTFVGKMAGSKKSHDYIINMPSVDASMVMKHDVISGKINFTWSMSGSIITLYESNIKTHGNQGLALAWPKLSDDLEIFLNIDAAVDFIKFMIPGIGGGVKEFNFNSTRIEKHLKDTEFFILIDVGSYDEDKIEKMHIEKALLNKKIDIVIHGNGKNYHEGSSL